VTLTGIRHISQGSVETLAQRGGQFCCKFNSFSAIQKLSK